ncbi:class I adenylate-forming enzyme family protein [Aliihoeflea sp. 40Bstr573]|uniref:class I adenylate-forming enzyme family protein n=1 Tax=Aliihoeflea sp. 40Bstr573 TaxID=2696467 RepID=UPI002095CD1E|nr:AMP-binding protein [Aliihoeflea sp. 40Bstr573]MCO6388724.1 AMP-binding protein [Aliihoeflea sp. 40Bstr573]
MKPSNDHPVDIDLARRASGLTIGSLFALRVRCGPERVALEQGDRRMTYAELDRRADRLCNHLVSLGIMRGDRVAILSENRIEYIELLIAAAKLGIIAACQNWRLADEELRHCLGLVTPKLILASPRHADVARRHGEVAPVLVFGPDYEQALDAASAERIEDECDPEDGVVILYTSGTTGLPKGALISQRAEIARAMIQMIDLPNTADEHFVAWAPLFHMVSTDTVFMTLMQGGKVIVTDGFDADELAGIVTRERLGRLTLMPGMITPFLAAMKRAGASPAGVRWAGVMADLVPREQIAEVTQLLDAPYLNSFGSTETGLPPASLATIAVGVVPAGLDKIQNSFCRIKLVDPDGREVADGEPGELAIRGPSLFSGYWNNPEANREDLRGGWFHMGDVFVRNPDGTLSFVDRRKYLIKSGGENIYPAEIERVLLSEPRVADAVVVRKSDPKWGEVPVAFVVRRDETLDAEALLTLCRRHIAGYKIPKDIRFVEDAELPRSTTGKIKRHDLEKRIA